MHDSPRPDITISMHDAAQQLAELGFNVFPLSPATKLPLTSAAKYPSERPRWGATRDPERIKNYFKKWPRANIGIETGVGFFIVEADTVEGHPDLKPGDGIAALDKLVADNGGWPETRKAISPTGSRHHYFRHPPGITIKASFKLEAGVEVLGYGNMAVAPPSIAPIAKGSKVLGRYRWLNNLRMAEAPPWLINLCKRDETERFASSSDDDEVDIDKACAALDAMPNDDFDEEKWYRLMGAAFVAGGGNIEVFDAFVRMSKRSSKHDDKRTRDRWRAFQRNPPRDIRAATLYWFADETAPGWRDRWHQKIMASVFAPLPDDAPSSPPPGSDAGPPPQQDKARRRQCRP